MLDVGASSMSVQVTDPAFAGATPGARPSMLATRGAARLKDFIDPVIAAFALLVLLPLFVVLAVAVRLSSPGPVLHRRRVLGLGGQEFDALKFRTMVADADAILERDAALRQAFQAKQKLTNDPRTTAVGRFLRKYSLDELPQLVNVLRGQMWLIGPRMIAPDEVGRYGSLVSRLVTVKPGMTGLWQVSGRQNTTYERRVELDMQYIDSWSLLLDLTILCRTVSVVVTGHGGY